MPRSTNHAGSLGTRLGSKPHIALVPENDLRGDGLPQASAQREYLEAQIACTGVVFLSTFCTAFFTAI
jgi:hypothetical protein